MRLREATLEDVPRLVPLMAALGYPTDEATLGAGFGAILGHPDYRTVVAEVDGALAGLVGMRKGLRYEGGAFVQLAALVVADAYQGRGVGGALVAEVERWTREQGAMLITLNSGHHRLEAHRFYQRRGYESSGLRFAKRLDEHKASST
jgi:GNAT superfamily N-acetyltransferase